MNFINPYISIYFDPQELGKEINLPFSRDVTWTFLKNLNNNLKLFQHRVNIVFTKNIETVGIEKTWSIFSYRYKIEPSTFNQLDLFDKKRKLLDIIYEAFTAFANEYNWDKYAIENAYKNSISEVGKFEYYTELKKSKNRQFDGRIKLELTGFTLHISAELNDLLNHKNKSFKIIDVDEDKLSWSREIKEYGWYDNSRFGLKFLKGELWIIINIDSGEIEEIVRSNKKSVSEIENYLKALKRRIFSNKT